MSTDRIAVADRGRVCHPLARQSGASRGSGSRRSSRRCSDRPGSVSILENVWLGSRDDPGCGKPSAGGGQVAGSRDTARQARSMSTYRRRLEPVRAPSLLHRAVARHRSRAATSMNPSASLDAVTRDRPSAVLRERTSRGVSVLFISHRMDEIFAISDVVTVLRSGVTVASRLLTSDSSPQQLVSLMSEAGEAPAPRSPRTPGPVLLRAEDVRLGSHSGPITFELRAGERWASRASRARGRTCSSRSSTAPRFPTEGPYDASTATHMRWWTALAGSKRNRLRAAWTAQRSFEQVSIQENFGLPSAGRRRAAGSATTYRSRLHRVGARLRIKMRNGADRLLALRGAAEGARRRLCRRPQILLLNDPDAPASTPWRSTTSTLLLDLCARAAPS